MKEHHHEFTALIITLLAIAVVTLIFTKAESSDVPKGEWQCINYTEDVKSTQFIDGSVFSASNMSERVCILGNNLVTCTLKTCNQEAYVRKP